MFQSFHYIGGTAVDCPPAALTTKSLKVVVKKPKLVVKLKCCTEKS